VTRIGLIHATPLAVDPIAAAFERLWPEVQLHNIWTTACRRTGRETGD